MKSLENDLKEGETLFAEGRFDEAEEFFLSVVEKDKNNKEAYNNIGVLAIQKEDVKSAIEHFSRSLEIDPFYKTAFKNFTDLLKTINQLHIAIPLLEKIAEINPDDENIRQLLKDAQNAIDNRTENTDYVQTGHTPHSISNSANSQDILSGIRILHAPVEVAGNMARITKYLRLHNVNATSINYYDSWLEYQCDLNLNVSKMEKDERTRTIDSFARTAMDKYDIFHFHLAHSLYPGLRDLEELKQKGKKIIFSFWGSDERGPEWIFYQQARFLGYHPPKPYYLTLRHYHDQKTINRYADVMLGTSCIPRGLWFSGQIDASEWSLEEKERIIQRGLKEKDPKKTYFLHAPSNNWKKGSSIIINLLEECKNEGMPIEILYVSNITPEEAKQTYAYADYAIDQVGVGTFGLFGIEMMCWQIPVLAYQIGLYDRIRNDPPLVKITKADFKSQISKCIEMKKNGEIVELGRKGRQWVFENADISSRISEYLKMYSDLVEGKRIKQYTNKSWYEQEQLIQSGFKSEFYKYMIENNVFNEIGIKITNYDKRLYV